MIWCLQHLLQKIFYKAAQSTKLWIMSIYEMTLTVMHVQSHIGQNLWWPLGIVTNMVVAKSTDYTKPLLPHSVHMWWPWAKYFPVRPCHLVTKYILFITSVLKSLVILAIWVIKTYSLTMKIFYGFLIWVAFCEVQHLTVLQFILRNIK